MTNSKELKKIGAEWKLMGEEAQQPWHDRHAAAVAHHDELFDSHEKVLVELTFPLQHTTPHRTAPHSIHPPPPQPHQPYPQLTTPTSQALAEWRTTKPQPVEGAPPCGCAFCVAEEED